MFTNLSDQSSKQTDLILKFCVLVFASCFVLRISK